MNILVWKTAQVVGHPAGDIWAVLAADSFDRAAGVLETVAAAVALMSGVLPAGGLVADYLFCEELERVALAAEMEHLRAQREFLKCSVLTNIVVLAQAQIEAARLRYVSATMSALTHIADAKAVPANFLRGRAFVAMQGHSGDLSVPLSIAWEAGHDGYYER